MANRGIGWKGELVNRQHNTCGVSKGIGDMHDVSVLDLHGTHGCVMVLLTTHVASTSSCNFTDMPWIIELHLVLASGLHGFFN